MKSILIVDDQHDISLALDLILTDEGYEVILASNGREALQRLAEKRFDLVLLDQMMPILTGAETLKAMRADPEYANIPVILMSAVKPMGRREDLDWDGFIRKPFDLDRLLEIVSETIGRRRR